MQLFIKVNMRQDCQWFSDWECDCKLQNIRYTIFGLQFRILCNWFVDCRYARFTSYWNFCLMCLSIRSKFPVIKKGTSCQRPKNEMTSVDVIFATGNPKRVIQLVFDTFSYAAFLFLLLSILHPNTCLIGTRIYQIKLI